MAHVQRLTELKEFFWGTFLTSMSAIIDETHTHGLHDSVNAWLGGSQQPCVTSGCSVQKAYTLLCNSCVHYASQWLLIARYLGCCWNSIFCSEILSKPQASNSLLPFMTDLFWLAPVNAVEVPPFHPFR